MDTWMAWANEDPSKLSCKRTCQSWTVAQAVQFPLFGAWSFMRLNHTCCGPSIFPLPYMLEAADSIHIEACLYQTSVCGCPYKRQELSVRNVQEVFWWTLMVQSLMRLLQMLVDLLTLKLCWGCFKQLHTCGDPPLELDSSSQSEVGEAIWVGTGTSTGEDLGVGSYKFAWFEVPQKGCSPTLALDYAAYLTTKNSHLTIWNRTLRPELAWG